MFAALARSRLPAGPEYYPKDLLSEHPERFFVAEIVREKVRAGSVLLLHQ